MIGAYREFFFFSIRCKLPIDRRNTGIEREKKKNSTTTNLNNKEQECFFFFLVL